MLLRFKIYDRVKFGVIVLLRPCEYECHTMLLHLVLNGMEDISPRLETLL